METGAEDDFFRRYMSPNSTPSTTHCIRETNRIYSDATETFPQPFSSDKHCRNTTEHDFCIESRSPLFNQIHSAQNHIPLTARQPNAGTFRTLVFHSAFQKKLLPQALVPASDFSPCMTVSSPGNVRAVDPFRKKAQLCTW